MSESLVLVIVLVFALPIYAASVVVLGFGAVQWAKAISAVANARVHVEQADAYFPERSEPSALQAEDEPAEQHVPLHRTEFGGYDDRALRESVLASRERAAKASVVDDNFTGDDFAEAGSPLYASMNGKSE